MDVYPSLTYRNVEAALAFLTKAFGLTVEEIGRAPLGAVRFASLRYGDGRVLVQPDLLTSCTAAISDTAGPISPYEIRTRISRVRVTPARKYSDIHMMHSMARCAATARAIRKVICGASAPIGRAAELAYDPTPGWLGALDDAVAQVSCLRFLDHARRLEPDRPACVIEETRA